MPACASRRPCFFFFLLTPLSHHSRAVIKPCDGRQAPCTTRRNAGEAHRRPVPSPCRPLASPAAGGIGDAGQHRGLAQPKSRTGCRLSSECEATVVTRFPDPTGSGTANGRNVRHMASLHSPAVCGWQRSFRRRQRLAHAPRRWKAALAGPRADTRPWTLLAPSGTRTREHSSLTSSIKAPIPHHVGGGASRPDEKCVPTSALLQSLSRTRTATLPYHAVLNSR